MKLARWKTLAAPIEAVLPGFAPMKTAGFLSLHEWTAACVLMQSSDFSADAFYIELFAMPRFIPTSHLYFTYGFRVGDRWNDVSNDLVHQISSSVPRLQKLATLDGMASAAHRWHTDLHQAELRLCIGVLREDTQMIEAVRESIAAWPINRAWEPEILKRCNSLLDDLTQGGYERAHTTLAERRNALDALLH